MYNKYNNEYNNDYDNMCPICHEIIDLNIPESYIILDCCKQSVHLDCIVDWTNSNFAKNTFNLIVYIYGNAEKKN